ncbi:MAG TPA: fumarylacetoacetate hydrolase family protein [Gammaproteobacteria bacterium]|nr:fumarylacetoacetate hydrolase family protein [Gammaproteobacteria bacterium]
MKLATYRYHDEQHLGLVDRENACIYPATACVPGAPDELIAWVKRYGVDMPQVSYENVEALPLAHVSLEAPIPKPERNIMCVGKNYLAHANEFSRSGFDRSDNAKAAEAPEAPIIFTKAPSSVIGPGGAVRYPAGLSEKLDYEAEVGVVIGRGGRGIRRSEAYSHVFGYVIINDVTARDLQALHRQWFIGKSMDTFCPMGPWVVTSDEIDPENLSVRCWVNDELRQDANTRDLIFDIPTLVETLSAGITLMPGDIIATGTPQGVGIGFDPPRFLKPGDRMRVAIDGLGELENSVGSA